MLMLLLRMNNYFSNFLNLWFDSTLDSCCFCCIDRNQNLMCNTHTHTHGVSNSLNHFSTRSHSITWIYVNTWNDILSLSTQLEWALNLVRCVFTSKFLDNYFCLFMRLSSAVCCADAICRHIHKHTRYFITYTRQKKIRMNVCTMALDTVHFFFSPTKFQFLVRNETTNERKKKYII